ncbi:unnamed protein product [Owenia fusiformis]|uniref:Uncharacterized protein n=1 Tax=Owenia fusiformis TaxID=6347 RepID=A0A8S4PU47_OWEFU|nr:unnamed protein product [Owenia fusiformis]
MDGGGDLQPVQPISTEQAISVEQDLSIDNSLPDVEQALSNEHPSNDPTDTDVNETLFLKLQNLETLNAKLQVLRQNKVLCDVIFKVQDAVQIWAHKNVLCGYSFQAINMFASLNTSTTVEIEMPNVSATILENIVNYMYGEELQITPDNVQEVYQAAEILKMPDVTNVCLQLRADLNLSADNVVVAEGENTSESNATLPPDCNTSAPSVGDPENQLLVSVAEPKELTLEEFQSLLIQESSNNEANEKSRGVPDDVHTTEENVTSESNNMNPQREVMLFPDQEGITKTIDLRVLGPTSYQCGQCEKIFPTMTRLRRHTLCHTAFKQFQCPECEKCFAYKHHIKSHYLAMHTENRSFRCVPCDKSFPNSSYLSCHNTKVHGARKCNKCNLVFPDRLTLAKHKTKHSVAYKVICSECEMKFPSYFKLASHMKQDHSHIEFTIPKKAHPRNKTRVKSDTKEDDEVEICEYCAGVFKSQVELQEHINEDHKDVERSCSECDYKTASKAKFRRHEQIHYGVRPFQCTKCDKRESFDALISNFQPTMDEDTSAGITLHDNVKKGFMSGESYDNHRPTYTEEATRFVLDKCNFEENDLCQYDILELGAGTGLFTRQLLNCANQKGLNVIATDPLDVFLVKLRAALPGVKTMQCSAESIPLPSCSVKNVVAAQSLHWFANNKAFTEINRVLAPGGKLVFLWNTMDRTQNGTLTYEIATHMLSLEDNTSSHEIMDGALWKGELENCSGYSPLKGHCFYQHLKHSVSTCHPPTGDD